MKEKYKDLLANNLTKFRKAAKLTQYELAEKLNYSDKAISKWERGEAFPDIFVLKDIADLYGITIDQLFASNIKYRIRTARIIMQNRWFITALSFVATWALATLAYFILSFACPDLQNSWVAFIYNIPISFTVLFILFFVWKYNYLALSSLSVTLWSTALSLFLSISSKLYLIFILCIPVQLIILIIVIYLKFKSKWKRPEKRVKKEKDV